MANYRKKKGAGRVVAIVLAVLLGVVVLVGSSAWVTGWTLTGEVNPANWAAAQAPSDGDDVGGNNDPATGEKYVDGMITTISYASKMRLASVPMTAAETSNTDSRYMLTATVDPADADEQTLIWTVAFKNPSSEWANGKTVTNYVTVTPTSDTKHANVNCLAAFGEPIIVTVTSTDNPEAQATCTCDYVMRAQNLVFEFGSGGFDNISYNYSLEGTAHTIESELQITSMTMTPISNTFAYQFNQELKPLLRNAGISADYTNYVNYKTVNLIINQESKTVSVPGGTANAFFVPEDGSEYDGEGWFSWPEKDKATVNALIPQAFRQAVNNTSGNHIRVTVSYTLTHNGTVYGEGTIDTYFSFNYQTIKVGVNGVSLDYSGIVFSLRSYDNEA